VTFEIDIMGDMVRLNVIHDQLQAGSDMARGISKGWPRVLSSMKPSRDRQALDTWRRTRKLRIQQRPRKTQRNRLAGLASYGGARPTAFPVKPAASK